MKSQVKINQRVKKQFCKEHSQDSSWRQSPKSSSSAPAGFDSLDGPQVGCVTAICATCFAVRALIVAWSALDRKDADLDVLNHPLLNIVYYTSVELVPSALVLYILRKLPPRRSTQGYQQIPVR